MTTLSMLCRFALVLGLASASAVAHVAAEKPEPRDLIQRHLDVTGGPNNHAGIVGMKRIWNIAADNFTGTVESVWTPDAYRTVLKSKDGSWSTAWGEDAAGAWQMQPNGAQVKADPVEACTSRMQADPAAFVRGSKHFRRLATANHVKTDDGNFWRVLAAPQRGKVITFLFDDDSGRMTGATFNRTGPDGKPMQVDATYDDWRQFGPITMSYRITEKSKQGTAVLTLTGVDVRPIKPHEFERMGSTDIAPAKPGQGEATEGEHDGDEDGEHDGEDAEGDHHRLLLQRIGPTVTMANGSTVSSASLANVPNVLLYFSAKWCPPCRAFTPKLVDFAKQATGGDVVVLFVSSDHSPSEMLAYMQAYDMPFPAVDFAETAAVKQAWGASGIPNLVWLGPDDQVRKGSYDSNGTYTPKTRGSYIGPDAVLNAYKNR